VSGHVARGGAGLSSRRHSMGVARTLRALVGGGCRFQHRPGQRAFEHVTSVLPGCMARGYRRSPQPRPRTLSSITPITYGRLGDAAGAWNVTTTIRNPRGGIVDKFRMDVVVVRTGRAVFWDELGTYFSYSNQSDISGRELNDRILHNALRRAHG
jgi:hypothetical protein